MSSLDFDTYLSSQIPSLSAGQAQVTTLTGGFINFTVRVAFNPPVVYRSTTLHSVILKHAQPFVRAQPDQPLSTHRQTVEAKALQLLAGKEPLLPEFAGLAASFTEPQVPRLIHHDTQNHVLWISDLGQCQSLSEYLKAEQPPQEDHVRNTATQLAGFMCGMYRLSIDPPRAFLDSLKDPAKAEGEGSDLGFLADQAKTIMSDAKVEDAEELSQVVRRGLQNKPEHPSLGMGDFWPASVLIDPQGSCGLIDWEWFGPCDPSGELGMFLAHLHVMSLDTQTAPSAKTVIRAFTTQFLKSCAGALREQDSFVFSTRCALISHGRELVNGVDLYSATLNAESKARLVKAGAESLRAVKLAGNNEPSVRSGLEEDLRFMWDDLEILQR